MAYNTFTLDTYTVCRVKDLEPNDFFKMLYASPSWFKYIRVEDGRLITSETIRNTYNGFMYKRTGRYVEWGVNSNQIVYLKNETE